MPIGNFSIILLPCDGPDRRMKSVMHMRVARSFLFVLLAYYFIGDAKAASMSVVVGTFALACMNHVDEPSRMSELNKGGVKLPPEQADPLLKPEHGSAICMDLTTADG
jgi:hypothetical protein